MHGRPRKTVSQKEEEASAVKGAELRSLQSQFLEFHHSRTYTKEALELNAKLVELNPEYYSAWNYRKLAVEHLLNDQSDSESIISILNEELRIVENALMKNIKSYGAWHHRKWVLSKGQLSTGRELLLLGKFQKLDARNFHAWNYRRFITALKSIPDEEELQYTTDMIYDNFSNYSAWHNRSVLLSHLLKKKVEGYFPKENVLTEEFEFVRNALFTDPDDQSGWFYHLWLLDQTVKVEHLLVSSWPPNGSDFRVSDDVLLDSYALSPSLLSKSRTFPLILCFSEAVIGVNSSTIRVDCEGNTNSNFIWTPISANKSGWANTWLTYLNFPIEEIHPSKHYQAKVSIAYSQGIVTSTGVCCSHPSYIAFTVSLPPRNSEHEEGQDIGRIWWSEENFFPNELLSEELSLINALHQLRMNDDNKPKTYEINVKVIADEIAYCRELLSQMDCKIGKLTLARLLMAHGALLSASQGAHDQNMFQYKEILDLYHDLMKLDPPHNQYYKDEYSLVFLKQELASKQSLLKYCYRYGNASSLGTNNSLCLRLNGLSLSRLGCIERLLWVQMLDLSNNELRSIEGLEAMQLLCCLNLSKNRFCSFSALEPLRLLRSLKVLDISYNEIGRHSIDTRRYLCASPLSHTVGSDWNSEEFGITSLEMTNYWDAFSIFRGLNLRQLDMVGNPIADEKFKLFICKLLPTMKSLDGEIL